MMASEKSGVEQISEVDLTEQEAAELERSADAVREPTDRTCELLARSQA